MRLAQSGWLCGPFRGADYGILKQLRLESIRPTIFGGIIPPGRRLSPEAPTRTWNSRWRIFQRPGPEMGFSTCLYPPWETIMWNAIVSFFAGSHRSQLGGAVFVLRANLPRSRTSCRRPAIGLYLWKMCCDLRNVEFRSPRQQAARNAAQRSFFRRRTRQLASRQRKNSRTQPHGCAPP